MKTKAIFTILAILSLLAGCKSTPQTAPDELDIAIREASNYLNSNIPRGSKIAILNIESVSPALSEYIIDELIANAVNDRVFSVVDRQQLNLIRNELDFNLSGEVSDESAQSIGQMLGAQSIVSGAVSKYGDTYRLRIRALAVETAQVQGQFNRNIPEGPTINSLTSSTAVGYIAGTARPAASVQASGQASVGSAPQATAPATPAYRIGGAGPAGGLIFYDKGNNAGGWRYLEASPADLGTTTIWMPSADMFRNAHRTGVIPNDTSSAAVRANQNFRVGSGLTNTEDLMSFANANGGGFGWAFQLCDELSINGFDDWFLPSFEELNFMYGNLHRRGLGNFRNEIYWSSTANYNGETPFAINFVDGSERAEYIGNAPRYRVRAARRF
jgi:TolB-like protein